MIWFTCALIGGALFTAYTLFRGPGGTAGLLKSRHSVQGIAFSIVIGGVTVGTVLWALFMFLIVN